MTRRVSRGWIASLVAVASCSSLTGRPLAEPPAVCTTKFFLWTSCEEATGVPYSLSRPTFSIQQKTLTGGKKARSIYEIVVGYEADESRRFEVGMTRGFLTNDTFELTLDPGGRALSMNSTRADQTGKTIAALVTTAAAAAGVAARAAAVFSKPDKQAAAKELCDWIDQRFKPRFERIEAQEDQVELDASRPDHDQAAIDRRRRELDLGRIQIEEGRCSIEEKKVGTDAATCTEPIDDGCKALLNGIAKKASRVLAEQVCDTQRYVELAEPVKQDETIHLTWDLIAAVKKFAAGTEPADILIAQFKTLRKRVDIALAEAVVAEANQSSDRDQTRHALDEAIKAYKRALKVVLDADQRLNERALASRRTLLLDFVSKKPPTGRGRGEDYAKYRAELDAVDQALQEVLPKAKAPEEVAAIDATDLTGTIDTGVLTERYARRLTDEEMESRVSMAHVEIGVGCATAIVIADPDRLAEGGAK